MWKCWGRVSLGEKVVAFVVGGSVHGRRLSSGGKCARQRKFPLEDVIVECG